MGAVSLQPIGLLAVGHDVSWFAARTALLAVTAGDLTGAGDTFAAALFILLAESGDPAAALRLASAAADAKVEHRGPGGIPDPAAIRTRAGAAP